MQSSSNNTDTKSTPAQLGANSKHQSGASGEFHNFIADMEDLVKATTNLTGEDLAKAKTKISERLEMAKESITEMGESIVHRVGKGATITNQYVHDKPWNAIGSTAVVGFLLGYLLARRT